MASGKLSKLCAETLENRLMLTHGVAVLHPDAPTLPVDLAPCVAQIGDSNVDGRFDESDLVAAMQSAKYETGEQATFEEGDWNADGVFDSGDLVDAMQSGHYRDHDDNAVLTCRTLTWQKTLDPFAPGAIWKGTGMTDEGVEVEVRAYDFQVAEDGATINALTFEILGEGRETVSLVLSGTFTPGAAPGRGAISLSGPMNSTLESTTTNGVVTTMGEISFTDKTGETVTVTYEKTLDLLNPRAVWKGPGQTENGDVVTVRLFDLAVAEDGVTFESATFEISGEGRATVSLEMIGAFVPGTEPGTGAISLVGTRGSALNSTTVDGLVTTMGRISYLVEGPIEDGSKDEIGAASLITPESVLEAAQLIKTGKTYSLAHVLRNDSPTNAFVGHSVDLDLVVGPLGSNEFVALAETVHSNFMHVGTQFDSLGHVGIGTEYYNDNTFDELFSPHGLRKLGAENVPPFFTRGVLVDVAKYKGVDILPPTYEITLDDLEGTLQSQRVQIRKGDVVLFNTGWGTHFTTNPELFVESQPGIGLDVARALASEEVVLVGADNVFVDVFPNPDESLVLPVHQELLTKNGIYLMEIVKTDELARDEVYEFAFAFAPIRVEGATGSAAHPFAIG